MREKIRLFFETFGFTRSEIVAIQFIAVITAIGAGIPAVRSWIIPPAPDVTAEKEAEFRTVVAIADSGRADTSVVSEITWHHRAQHIESLVKQGQTDSAVVWLERLEDAPVLQVNINTAGTEELASLPKVGPKLAERIIDYRRQNGPFENVDQLTAVKGIGKKMLEKIRPYITIH
jgi:comEA protein